MSKQNNTQMEIPVETIQSREKFDKAKFDANLGKSIRLAIELEQMFKLYSYRIISPEEYLEAVKEAIKSFQK